MANCLQFNKEVDLNPGNSGTSRTRALACELLAIKLLKEFTTRELIDALSYDFFPLQGQSPNGPTKDLGGPNAKSKTKQSGNAARISCLEIAIRAQAKRFLAHPLVVQQLEAIWAGTIVFHSAADSLHRTPSKANTPHAASGYGSISTPDAFSRLRLGILPTLPPPQDLTSMRRSVTLYDPRDASLFKLSRLRVPRYRQFLSTASFAILLGLYLAVIVERSLDLTALEILFWFWSAGFMLDEVVGFNEQGFSLYLMSFWNIFDLGILLLLCCYYCLRLYGVLMPDPAKHSIANQAYDILAASAVLLFPRLFSVLDHYRYFSQLLIAFRIMAADLMAVFVLIVIACSGFFVAFTFSFGAPRSSSEILYALLQMLMGFTPAAWDLWPEYNALGRVILTIFLFICHFVVVTILITVLTNSFMAIVQNANDEHQFVFAVNTISMVKSDALFSYVAPTNILAWIITPLRYCMSFRRFIKVNRTVIKITHFPILFSICLYEKTILRSSSFVPSDLVEYGTRSGTVLRARHERRTRTDLGRRRSRILMREPSIATHQQDRALDEVFRRPFRENSAQDLHQSPDGRRKHLMVNDWMQRVDPSSSNHHDEEGPDDGDPGELRQHRLGHPIRRYMTKGSMRNFTDTARSVASDPEEFVNHDFFRPTLPEPVPPPPRRRPTGREVSHATDIDGDDERTSDENEDEDSADQKPASTNLSIQREDKREMSRNTSPPKFFRSRPSTAKLLSRKNSPTRRRPRTPQHHSRTASSGTVLYDPIEPLDDDGLSKTGSSLSQNLPKMSKPGTAPATPPSGGRRTPKRASGEIKRRSALVSKNGLASVPDFGIGLELGSDIGDNKALGGGFVGAIPSSFATQMMYAQGGPPRRSGSDTDSRDMLSKLVLARMNHLEEGFREVIKEVKDLRQAPLGRDQSQRVNREAKKKRSEVKGKQPQVSKDKRNDNDGDDPMAGEE